MTKKKDLVRMLLGGKVNVKFPKREISNTPLVFGYSKDGEFIICGPDEVPTGKGIKNVGYRCGFGELGDALSYLKLNLNRLNMEKSNEFGDLVFD